MEATTLLSKETSKELEPTLERDKNTSSQLKQQEEENLFLDQETKFGTHSQR
jgi:hypothetical protein